MPNLTEIISTQQAALRDIKTSLESLVDIMKKAGMEQNEIYLTYAKDFLEDLQSRDHDHKDDGCNGCALIKNVQNGIEETERMMVKYE